MTEIVLASWRDGRAKRGGNRNPAKLDPGAATAAGRASHSSADASSNDNSTAIAASPSAPNSVRAAWATARAASTPRS